MEFQVRKHIDLTNEHYFRAAAEVKLDIYGSILYQKAPSQSAECGIDIFALKLLDAS